MCRRHRQFCQTFFDRSGLEPVAMKEYKVSHERGM